MRFLVLMCLWLCVACKSTVHVAGAVYGVHRCFTRGTKYIYALASSDKVSFADATAVDNMQAVLNKLAEVFGYQVNSVAPQLVQ